MKSINNFIYERLKINKDSKLITHHFFPTELYQLRALLEKLLKERGKDADLNDIDVSKITTFYSPSTGNFQLFRGLHPRNIKIDKWDVSNVEDMTGVFGNCVSFNCDLSNWNVSNVKNMKSMFEGCKKFKGQGLENWDVSNVKSMNYMFKHCYKFTGQGLRNWKINNVKSASSMFIYCEKFDCDLSNWEVSNIETMNFMFYGCEKFKGDGLENWKPKLHCQIDSIFDNCDSLKKYPKWYLDNKNYTSICVL